MAIADYWAYRNNLSHSSLTVSYAFLDGALFPDYKSWLETNDDVVVILPKFE